VIDSDRCTGCNSCVLSCSFVHSSRFTYDESRVTIVRDLARSASSVRVCVQCDDAPCISSCPVDALTREDGSMRIVLDRERCIGCGKCVDSCPFGGVRFDREASLPLICDLCDGDPACVDACALPRAIRYESVPRGGHKEKAE
jgi:carbon-monoxide dehydrogenase iron sulfur subunit